MKRITGLILTVFVIFPAIIFLEWVFDLNNKKKFEEIEKRLRLGIIKSTKLIK